MTPIYSVVMVISLLVAPLTSQAGTGYYITIKNELNPGASRPFLTIHNNNGSNCWYDYGLADWAQYAMPGQSVEIYTEATNSGSCNAGLVSSDFVRIRGVGLFAGAPGVPWAPIWTGQAAPNDFKIAESYTQTQFESAPMVGQPLGYGICVKSYTGRYGDGDDLGRAADGLVIFRYQGPQYRVTITVAACSTLKASAADSNVHIANVESATPPPDLIPAPTNSFVNPKSIHVKVGQTVNVTVPTKQLNSDTEWDLGGCSSPGATQVIQHRHNAKGKRLADSLEITGVSPGSLTCALNANDYDESGHGWPVVQQVFNVVVR